MELTTDSINLSPLHYADKERLVRLANNRKIWLNVRDMFPHPYTVSDAERFIESTTQQDPQTTFAIRYNLKFAGAIGLVLQGDVYRFSAELGYWIGEPFWRQGFATEATGAAAGYLPLQISLTYERNYSDYPHPWH